MRRLCQTLKVHPSGYYAWLAEPQSARAKEDQRLLGLIKQAWLESGGVYGYRKIHDDLRELGESMPLIIISARASDERTNVVDESLGKY